MRFSVVLALFAALVLCCAFAKMPTEEAFDRCAAIGVSSGCSGCNAPNIDCEWCVDPNDQSWQPSGQNSLCAPEGYCAEIGYGDLVPAPTNFCPPNPLPRGEPLLHGSEISIASQTRWNGYFDSWYCEFPRQPWIIDRFANPLGDKDPVGNCFEVNNRLAVGQRNEIQNCAQLELSLPRHAECVRLYQSHLCTSACPEYGVANDFSRLCYGVCHQLLHTCDEDLLDCLLEEFPLPFNPYEDCLPKDEKRCFRPDLIEPHGRFDHDLCLTGSEDSCTSADCKVVPIETLGGPSGFGSQPSPCCFCLDSSVNDDLGYGCDGSHAVYAFQITQSPVEDGVSCEDIVVRRVRTLLGRKIDHTHTSLCKSSDVGAVCVYEVSFTDESTPAWCDDVADITSPNACVAVGAELYD